MSRECDFITKAYLYNFDPLKPHFYRVKLGFTVVYIIFLFLLKNIDCGYSLEPPRRGGSNEYHNLRFWVEIWKISEFFLSENFQFLVVKCSIYLNRCVFVMSSNASDSACARLKRPTFYISFHLDTSIVLHLFTIVFAHFTIFSCYISSLTIYSRASIIQTPIIQNSQ